MSQRDQSNPANLRKAALRAALLAGVCLPAAPAAAAEAGGILEVTVDWDGGCSMFGWIRVPTVRVRTTTDGNFVPEVDTKVEKPELPPNEVFTPQPARPTYEVEGYEYHSPPPGPQSPDAQTPTEVPKTAEQPPEKTPETPKPAPGDWIDEKGKPVAVGPDGTPVSLTDSDSAYNVHTHKSYVKGKDGVWKDKETGKTVPLIPIYTKIDSANPKSATHIFTGKKFTQFGSGEAPPQSTKPEDKQLKPEDKAKEESLAKLKIEQKQLGQQLDQKVAEIEEFKQLIKKNPKLYPDAKANQARLDQFEKELGKLSVAVENKEAEVWKLESGQPANAEQAKPEPKRSEPGGATPKTGQTGGPAGEKPNVPSYGISQNIDQAATELYNTYRKFGGQESRSVTIYANIKADEDVLRRGAKTGQAIPEQTLKFGFNPLPIPDRGDKDAETGAGKDPPQATIRRTGRFEIPEDERKTFKIPYSYQGSLYFEYMPKDYKGFVARTTTGEGAEYPVARGVEIHQRDFKIGQDSYRRVGLEFSYGSSYGESFARGAYVMDACWEKKPAPPGAQPVSTSALGNELPATTLRLQTGQAVRVGSGPR